MGRISRLIVLLVILPISLIALGNILFTTFNLRNEVLEKTRTTLDIQAQYAAADLTSVLAQIETTVGLYSGVLEDEFSLAGYRAEGDSYITDFRNEIAPLILTILDLFQDSVGSYFMLAPDLGSVPSQVWYNRGHHGEVPERIFEYPEPRDFNPDDPALDYYYTPIRTRLPYWSDIYTDLDVGTLMISYTVPVFSEGQVVGIVGLDLSMDTFGEPLKPLQMEPNQYAFLFSAKEQMIYHPYVESGVYLDDFVDPDSSDLTEKFRSAGQTGTFEYRYQGKNKIMGYRRLDNGWFVGVTTDRDSALHLASRVQRIVVFVAAMVVLSAVVISIILVRLVIRPLRLIREEVLHALGDDEYFLGDPDIGGRTEIGDVYRAFMELHTRNRRTMEELAEENLQRERLSAMGEKLPDLTHEVEGQLGTVITGVSYAQDSITDLEQKLVAGELSRDEALDILERLNSALDLAFNAAKHASRVSHSVKVSTSAQIHPTRSVFNLVKLIDEVCISLNHLAKKKSVEYDLQVPETLFLDSIPGYIGQILDNLIRNSIRHGFEGKSGGRIRISAQSGDQGLIMEYSDDGNGIADADRSSVFERFFTTARDRGGTGIGLYIVKSLVERELHGSIELLNASGSGVLFRIILPKLPPAGETVQPEENPPVGENI